MILEGKTAYPGVYAWPAQLPNAVLHRTLVKVPNGEGKFFMVELSSTRGESVHHYSYHRSGPNVSTRNASFVQTGNTYAGVDAGRAMAFASPYDFDEVDVGCRASVTCVETHAYLYRRSGFQFLPNAAVMNNRPTTLQVKWDQYDWVTGAILPNIGLRGFLTFLAGVNQVALIAVSMPNGTPVRYLIARTINTPAGSALVNVWEPHRGQPQVRSVTSPLAL